MHRILIVGGGSIGERHLRCFLKTGRVEASLCDNRPERLKQMAATYPVQSTYTDFEKIDLSKFDVVVICVPANLHVPWSLRAVEAGAHVFIEKPLSISVAGIDELQAAVERKGVVAGVAHVRRALLTSQIAKQESDSGRIGDVLNVFWMVGYDHRVARPDYKNTYWTSRATGGGAVLDLSSHMSNLVQWFLGPVKTVTAVYDHLQMEGTPCEDTLSYVMRFRNSPAIATMHCVAWQAHRCDMMTLTGVKGSIVCDVWEGKVGVVDRADHWTWKENLKPKPDAKGQVDDPFIFQAENFLNAVEGKEKVLCTLAEGRHTIEICEATYESGQRHCEVKIG